VRWSVWEFFGYQYIAEVDTYLRVEPGFGIANLAGLIALIFALALAATSFDWAVNWLGTSSWKWLHTFAYVVFYLTAIHVVYFAFIHYTPSLQRVLMGAPTNYPDNPLRYYYLIALLSVFVMQTWAFIKTVRKQRNAQW
jgi:sulfoxide reductase heme-binding subunit YedZ